MGLLRLAVLGPPEVVHDGSRLTFALRKAQALLLYLAVEGGMHSRSKLAAFLWPDSAPHDARTALRNALALLRTLLADTSASPHSHLLSPRDLLGLDSQAPLELDLAVVQEAYAEAQRHSTLPAEPQRAALVAKFQQALCERLSSWQEAGGELEQARATLTRWLALDPLSEEACRRLMRVHLALGDASAALQVYATCRARLAEDLRVKPSAETIALAQHIRALAASSPGSPTTHPSLAASEPPGELVAPLVGRASAFRQLVRNFQQVQGGQPQAVLVVGEAGIGKTRLTSEWLAWARAQGADIMRGHVVEMGGRLPYQPLVEALRERLEAENAPEDLLEDVWLAELSRLLPELRVRYPDLSVPTEDELTAKGQLFEAVARLFDALARRAPLVLLLDDVHWLDGASLDLLRYLGHSWKEHGSRVLLLGTVRSEGLELNQQLSAQLADLGRDLPLSQVPLQPLSKPETLQLLEAIAGDHGTRNEGEQHEPGMVQPSTAEPWASLASALVALGDFLFVRTGGQPLYLLETLKLWRDRQWLVPRLAADGAWRLEPTREMAAAVAQEGSQHDLLPPSVRTLILARLAPLSRAARQLVQVVAVLATSVSAPLLWQLAEMKVQVGVEALEEAVKSGILHEEATERGRAGSYRFSHELIRDVVYTELGAARRQVLHQLALARLESEGARAAELAYHARSAGEVEAAYRYSVQAGVEAAAVFAVEDAIGHYEQARAWLQEHTRLQSKLSASEVERLYAHLGRAYANQNAWEQAQQAYEELLAYAKQQQLSTLVSMTLNRLAIMALQQSHDKPQVQALLEEALQMAQTSHDQKALAETEWNLAQITANMWDDPTSALPHGAQALSLAHRSVPGAVCATSHRADRFTGAFTCPLSQWCSAHPILDQSYVRSLVLGVAGFCPSACRAGAAQHTQWPQGARALHREQERLDTNQQYALPHLRIAGRGSL